MGASLAPRGPDGDGLWLDGSAGNAPVDGCSTIMGIGPVAGWPMITGIGPVGDQGQVLRVLALDALPGVDRRLRALRGHLQVAEQHVGPHALAVVRQGLGEVGPRRIGPRMHHLAHRELAAEVGDLLLVRAAGHRLELAGDVDRLVPLLLLLVDLEQVLARERRLRARLELLEHLLGAVQDAGLEVVLAELGQRDQLLLRAQPGALEQVLVHADGAVILAAPAEQAAEREVQLDGLRIDLDHLDERLDRLVGLLVQQEVEPLEVGARQRARRVRGPTPGRRRPVP